MKNNFLFAVLGIFFLTGLIALIFYKGAQVKTRDSNIQVAASVYPLYFFAKEIGGDKASVFNITPAGAEPHDYEPTTGDLIKIEKSDLLILNGGRLEAWGDKIKSELQNKNVIIILAGEDLIKKDPHVWLNPLLAKKEAEKIAGGYEAVDPKNNAYYEKNLKNLNDKLDELDRQYRKSLAACPKKDFITSHAAFGYLAGEYNLKQVAIAGLSPDEEPSPKKLIEITKFVKENNIKYIFFESLVSPKLSQAIADETKAQTLVLNPIEGLNDNELKQGKDYFTEMRKNLKNLRVALECV